MVGGWVFLSLVRRWVGCDPRRPSRKPSNRGAEWMSERRGQAGSRVHATCAALCWCVGGGYAHHLVVFEQVSCHIGRHNHVCQRKQQRVIAPGLGPRPRVAQPDHVEIGAQHVQARFQELEEEADLRGGEAGRMRARAGVFKRCAPVAGLVEAGWVRVRRCAKQGVRAP
jgi:hypothetical protein